MKSRTKARSLALQVLYEFDMTGHEPGATFAERLDDEPMDDSLASFSRQIVYGIIPIVGKLDQIMWEFAVENCTPIKVAINEAIELSKLYGSDSTPRFVNGVLGSLADQQDTIHQKLVSSSV
jgi:N utilization substance protein B